MDVNDQSANKCTSFILRSNRKNVLRRKINRKVAKKDNFNSFVMIAQNLKYLTFLINRGVSMGLQGYIAKRIFYSALLILFVITINFIIFEIMPTSPEDLLIGSRKELTPDQVARMRQLWGFDRPIYERYGKYVVNMLTFQWGYTVPTTGRRPVVNVIMQYLPNTLVLMGLSTMLAIVIGVILGVIAAYKRGGLYDTSSVVVSLLTMSLPTFWMGMMFLLFFMQGGPVDNMFGFFFPVGRIASDFLPPPITFNLFGFIFSLPTLVEIQDRLWHLFAPTFILALFQFGGYLLLTRATVIEGMTEDYVVTARAKGLKERTVLFKHILKNASLPIITSVAIGLGFMLSGAIITEAVFSYPGIGTLTIKSLDNLDYPVVHSIFYITALTVIVANFFADLLYGMMDPRIKYG